MTDAQTIITNQKQARKERSLKAAMAAMRPQEPAR